MTSAKLSASRVAEASAAALESFDAEEDSLLRDLEATIDHERRKRLGWQLETIHASRPRVLRLSLLAEAAFLEEAGRALMTVDAEDFRPIAAWYPWPNKRRVKAVEMVRDYASMDQLQGSDPPLVSLDRD
jgi:hypothetical protein